MTIPQVVLELVSGFESVFAVVTTDIFSCMLFFCVFVEVINCLIVRIAVITRMFNSMDIFCMLAKIIGTVKSLITVITCLYFAMIAFYVVAQITSGFKDSITNCTWMGFFRKSEILVKVNVGISVNSIIIMGSSFQCRIREFAAMISFCVML